MNGIIYLNRSSPFGINPVAGRQFYVGGRWSPFEGTVYPKPFSNWHAGCRNHLLFHGLWDNCP